MSIDPISLSLYLIYRHASDLLKPEDGRGSPPVYRTMPFPVLKSQCDEIILLQTELSRILEGKNDENSVSALKAAKDIGDRACALYALRTDIHQLETAKFDLTRTSPRNPFEHLTNCRVVWERICRSQVQHDHPVVAQVWSKFSAAQKEVETFKAMSRARQTRLMARIEQANAELNALEQKIQSIWRGPIPSSLETQLAVRLSFFRDVMPLPDSPVFMRRLGGINPSSLHALFAFIGGALLVSQVIEKDDGSRFGGI